MTARCSTADGRMAGGSRRCIREHPGAAGRGRGAAAAPGRGGDRSRRISPPSSSGRTRRWKLKKAVALGFLDFTDAGERERHAAAGMGDQPAPSRPASTATYAGDAGAGRRPGAGRRRARPVDWVLRMAPVPAGDFLDAVAARGGWTSRLLDAMADAVAAMHAALPPCRRAAPRCPRCWRAMPRRAGRRPAGGARRGLAGGDARPDRRGSAPLLAARAAAGLGPALPWRPASGQSVPAGTGRVTPFDALEFDEALATIDTGYDLAFLLMDLDHRVGRAAANRVLNRYVARSGDAGLVARPAVVAVAAGDDPRACRGRQACRAMACPISTWRRRCCAPPPPRLVAVGGLAGHREKSRWRAPWPRRSAPAPGALVLRADEIRKRQAGLAPEQRLPPRPIRRRPAPRSSPN